MTGRKYTRTATAKRLGKTRDQVDALIADGSLRVESIAGDHEVIPEQEIEEYERSHPRPTVGGGPELPADIEDDYQRGKDT